MKGQALAACLLTGIILSANAAEPAVEDPAVETADSVVQASNELLEVTNRYREQIADLESEYGPYDSALQEPLTALTDILIEAGEYEEAGPLLSRRLQLLRTQSGPANAEQIPILEELIANSIRLGEWRDVTDQFEYIRWLASQAGRSNVELLQAMDDIAQWQLATVYLGHPRRRTDNFLDSRQLQREIVFLAEETYGEDSPELIPWLYRQAVNQFRLFSFIIAEDELGYDAYEDIQKLEATKPEDYLRRGLNIIKRISDMVETMDNREATAMAKIYEADFQTLLKLGNGRRLYREARDQLLEAGLDSARVEKFFATPAVLPMNEMFLSFDELDAYLGQQRTIEINVPDEEVQVQMGIFTAWNESLPAAWIPPLPAMAQVLSPQFYEVDLLFDINSRGLASNPRVLRAEPDTNRLRRDARDAVKAMQFRPRLDGDRTSRVEEVTMRFRYPAPR